MLNIGSNTTTQLNNVMKFLFQLLVWISYKFKSTMTIFVYVFIRSVVEKLTTVI